MEVKRVQKTESNVRKNWGTKKESFGREKGSMTVRTLGNVRHTRSQSAEGGGQEVTGARSLAPRRHLQNIRIRFERLTLRKGPKRNPRKNEQRNEKGVNKKRVRRRMGRDPSRGRAKKETWPGFGSGRHQRNDAADY